MTEYIAAVWLACVAFSIWRWVEQFEELTLGVVIFLAITAPVMWPVLIGIWLDSANLKTPVIWRKK